MLRRRQPGCLLALLVLCGCAGDEPGGLSTWVGDWRDEVIYQIVTDRFDNGDTSNDTVSGVGPVPGDLSRFQGGDWEGITRRLPYIRSLGATAIWISPVMLNLDRVENWDGYHGYWGLDFTRPNPHMGTLEDLRTLCTEAHRTGLKVILDIVPNHTARVFYYDLDSDGQEDKGEMYPTFSSTLAYSESVGWLTPRPRLWRYPEAGRTGTPQVLELQARHFHRRGQTTDFLSQTQKELGDFPTGLRDLATERSDILEAMVDTTLRWVEQTDVDGVRIDAVPHVAHAFWLSFGQKLREALAVRGKERFLLLGEAYHTDPTLVASYTRAGGLDSVFDFALKWEVIDGVLLDGKAPKTAVSALETQRSLYPAAPQPGGVGLTPWEARVSFADNHDLARIRGELDDPNAAEVALTIVFTVDAIPSVYYGTEQELAGKGNHASREVMWQTGFRSDRRMFRHLQTLASLRRKSPALRRGTLVVRYASSLSGRETGPGAGLLCWERVLGKDRVLVAANTHPLQTAEASVQTGMTAGTRLVNGLSPSEPALIVSADGTVKLKVPPRRSQVWGDF